MEPRARANWAWKRAGRLLLAGLLVGGLLVLGATWLYPRKTHSSLANLSTPYKNAQPGVDFVGDASCTSCHAEIAASFHQHPMGRSMAFADETVTPGLNRDTSKVTFAASGLEYAVERRDGHIVHSETRKDAQGEVVRIETEVTYEFGSGHRGRSYLIERDGRLFQSPISWYSQQGRWDLSPDSLVRNNHFERIIDPSCVFCHANRFDPVQGTINGYKSPTFRGLAIGCERCHGPGGLHVRNPGVLSEGRDLTIVNPAHLEPVLRESVCEQCHLGGQSRVERLGRTALEFRPGLPLHEFLAVFVTPEQHSGAAKSIGHVEQMHASRCYRKNAGRLGCISCHDPHRLPSPEERTTYYRNRCLECHATSAKCSLAESARRERSHDDSCIQCHMPRSALSNVAHTAETNHSIPRRDDAGESLPIIASAPAADEWPLVPFSNELKTARRGEVDRELGIALAGLGAQQTGGKARLARLALPLLDASLKARPDDLVALQAKIVALTVRNRTSEAISTAETALALAPNDERTLNLTIPLLAGLGRRKEALALCQRLLALNPLVSEYHIMEAKLYAQLGQWREASDSCQAALRLEPSNLTARWILIRSAREMGDLARVRAESQTYLRFDPPENERNLVRGWIEKAR
jgi:hypothetical protein